MTKSNPRPFAVFDIDGTLIRWQLYHALADELVAHGKLDAKHFQKVREARLAWKQRRGESAFKDYEDELVVIFNAAITDIPLADIEQAGRAVITEYRDQVYRYTRSLVAELKAKNYLLFAISGSQVELVAELADYYGFDDYAGTEYEVVNGRFTGKYEPLHSIRKPEVLKKLVTKHGASWQGSLAIGDSEGDIAVLESVEQPLAFNPSKLLFEHARAQGWPIVVERKNMIYKLEPANGRYQLEA